MNGAVAPPAPLTRDKAGDRTPPLILVQVLRGMAAMLVLIGHTQGALAKLGAAVGQHAPVLADFPGGFGVDLFFCISGFIMVVASGRLFGAPGGWRVFLARRLVRLVPLYWCFTLAYLPLVLLSRHSIPGSVAVALGTSMAFIPFPAMGPGAGGVFPIYSLGWSLNYEMFFYVIFATFLFATRLRAVCATVAVLACLVLAGLVFAPANPALDVWTSAILLEFGFGLCIGLAWLGTARLPVWACPALALGAVGMLVADPMALTIKTATGTTPNDLVRVVGWGFPAAALLVSAVFLEKGRTIHAWGMQGLRRIGDASYSLYLVHPLVLLFLTKLLATPMPARLAARVGLAAWLAVELLCVSSAVAAGFVTHHWVEKPMTIWLNGRLARRSRHTNCEYIPSSR